jgi:O-antigen/teichoic acid export membrane protein
MQVLKLIKQFAQVFIPASSGLDARGDHEGLQGMLIRSAQYGMYLTLPMTVVLVILGGPLVRLWMGPGFEAPGVLAILAIGHLLSVAQLGPYSILEGMGRHGRPAIFELSGAVFGVGLTWFGLSTMNWSMRGAAMAVALAVGVSTGVVMPLYACRVVGLPISVYAKEVFPKPFLAVLPFAAGLGVAVWLSAVSPALALATSLAGVLGTGGLYVTWALPEGFATAFKERVESVWGQWRTRGRADVS